MATKHGKPSAYKSLQNLVALLQLKSVLFLLVSQYIQLPVDIGDLDHVLRAHSTHPCTTARPSSRKQARPISNFALGWQTCMR
jgi:hypothetical protein